MKPKKARAAIASVSRHIDKSHLVSSGIGACNVAQFHESAILKCGTSDNFLSSPHAQDVALGDDLQDDLLGSGHHNAHSTVTLTVDFPELVELVSRHTRRVQAPPRGTQLHAPTPPTIREQCHAPRRDQKMCSRLGEKFVIEVVFR
jgi:hypothetical protein